MRRNLPFGKGKKGKTHGPITFLSIDYILLVWVGNSWPFLFLGKPIWQPLSLFSEEIPLVFGFYYYTLEGKGKSFLPFRFFSLHGFSCHTLKVWQERVVSNSL